MTEDKAILDLLGPLMRALEMLAFVARHVHPPDFDRLMDSVGAPDEELRAARARQGEWPRHLSGVRAALDASSDAVLEAFSGLREVSKEGGEIRSVYRALRLLPKALEVPLSARRRYPAGEPVLSGPNAACRRAPAPGLARRSRPGRHGGHALRRSGAGRVLALRA